MCDALPDYCLRPPVNDAAEGVSHADFIKLVGSVPFVACAHGGGKRVVTVIETQQRQLVHADDCLLMTPRKNCPTVAAPRFLACE
jgi:hypothetical protein